MQDEQIDKVSKQLFRLKQRDKKWCKKQHTRRLRRESKKDLELKPLYNRYYGYIA